MSRPRSRGETRATGQANISLHPFLKIYPTCQEMGNNPSNLQLGQQQYQAMLDACRRGDMPELPPSPTWDINTPIDGTWTMLHIACWQGHESLVGQLLGVGASRNPPIDPNKTNRHGRTPLCYAARWGKEAVVRMLVARSDVDVNKAGPLAEACLWQRMGVVVALLECPRVDVNLMDSGQTALHVACERGFVEGVKVLLQVNGIDTNCKNSKGETPLDVAKRCKFTDICNLLKDHDLRFAQSSQLQAPPTSTTMTETAPTTRKTTSNVITEVMPDTTHVMSHVEQGEGTWRNILPENSNNNNNNNCKRSQVRIYFEDLPSFDEIVCGLCPLQMVVKLIISRKFGVEPTQQLIFTVGAEHNSEELLTDSSITLDDIQQQHKGSGVVVSLKVRIKSTTTIEEKDLKVVSQLGVGSYGTVFKCSLLHNTSPSSSSEPTTTTTFVAVKALHELIRSDFNVTQFQQEAVISSSLRHPNIVRCLGTCTTSTGSLLIVYELMEMSLTQLLHHKSLMFTEIVAISLGISKGMAALHLRNYMHRDLTCNNVLIDSHGTPKLADFGVSRALRSSSGDHRITVPPVSFTDNAGTMIYLPPQMHTRHYGLKGDMWEFAVLLSVLLNGTKPEVSPLKSASAVTQFLEVQRTSLSSSEVAELNRLCQSDPGELVVVECLSRRNAIISSLRSDPKLNIIHPACVAQFSLVVESCLSILESNRPSFPAIERMLMTCAGILFEGSTTTTQSASTAATAPSATTISDNRDLAARIAGCLEEMAASFPCHLNPSSTTTAASSFLSS
ncbi:ATP binding protein [Pelomyxa schiedti]|nr:ATP binding protein [Pelomyxa schiedti]